MINKYIFTAVLVTLGLLSFNPISVAGRTLNSNAGPIVTPHHSGSEYLDTEQKYLLSWTINDDEETIYFEVTVATKGFVGFGISPNGGMTGADIFIGGVSSNGTNGSSLYGQDYHGVSNSFPYEDVFDDWVLTYGEETATHTTLHFHRLLNTCDEHDFRITDGTMRVIWSFGETDQIQYHGMNRGTKSVNFYLQDEHEFEPEKYEKMDMLVDLEMPSEHTAYWCTIHRAPLFTETQHIVAFESIQDNAEALLHTHHFILRRCIAPEGQDPEELFEPWVGHTGDYCYGPKNSSFPFLPFCSQYAVYVWSKGGKRLVFPPDIGLPMPEKLGQREYYALDIHYDNPNELSGLTFQTGARMFYTPNLRETEVGLLRINQEVLPTLTIPPQVTDFLVAGHCSGECTERFLPEEGITIFNNLLHAHLAGRKLKLRHFRGEVELPWVDWEEYYDFDYQQNKPLAEYRKVERGDQLTVECTFDTMSADGGRAVLGGLGTREEMCEAIVYFYPKQDFTFCGSNQEMDAHFNLLGMTSYREKNASIAGAMEIEILEPEQLAGDYRESVSFKVNWTQEFRERFQNEKLYGEQIGFCRGRSSGFEGVVKYPDNLSVYVPSDDCQGITRPTPITTLRTTTTTVRSPGFQEWVMENIEIVQGQLTKLQESVDRLTGNQTLEIGQK